MSNVQKGFNFDDIQNPWKKIHFYSIVWLIISSAAIRSFIWYVQKIYIKLLMNVQDLNKIFLYYASNIYM